MVESGPLIEYCGTVYIQLATVERCFLALFLGLALIHAVSLGCVLLFRWRHRKFSYCKSKNIQRECAGSGHGG